MRPVTLPPSGDATWDELAMWWLSRYKPSTQRTYATYLPRWSRWCADRRINPLAVRRADVELWLRAVAGAGLSRASIAAHYDAVASIYRLAYEEELVAANPCARVTRPKIQRALQRREVLTVLEYAAFLSTARHLGTTHHAIAVLGGMMGLRATEMATLTLESIGVVRGYTTLIVRATDTSPPASRCSSPPWPPSRPPSTAGCASRARVRGDWTGRPARPPRRRRSGQSRIDDPAAALVAPAMLTAQSPHR